MKLGDKINVSYDIAAGSKVEQEIQVGRPSSEDNNETGKPWKHDIREVRVRFVVFGNAATAAQVDQEIDTLNERLAQCGVRTNVIEKKLGVAMPAEFSNGGFTRSLGVVQLPTADEREALNHFDADTNTVDMLIVPDLNNGVPQPGFPNGLPVRATAYPASRNASGIALFKDFMVIGSTRTQLSVGHELLHILLNDGHRGDPGTALFHAPTSDTKVVGGTKRRF